jgi:vancomycin resistance protein VanW
MELRSGCVVPALGGGLCMLSNALFELAARLDWKILERHGHTLEAAPSQSRPWGMDATVFWPYVDLRVQPRQPILLQTRVEDEALLLRVFGQQPCAIRVELESRHNIIEQGVRRNQIWRRRFFPDGGLEDELIAENRKHILHAGPQRRRNCLTCGESECHARVAWKGPNGPRDVAPRPLT